MKLRSPAMELKHVCAEQRISTVRCFTRVHLGYSDGTIRDTKPSRYFLSHLGFLALFCEVRPQEILE
jgi:hypothetical protein